MLSFNDGLAAASRILEAQRDAAQILVKEPDPILSGMAQAVILALDSSIKAISSLRLQN
jgi:hypothetical protein